MGGILAWPPASQWWWGGLTPEDTEINRETELARVRGGVPQHGERGPLRGGGALLRAQHPTAHPHTPAQPAVPRGMLKGRTAPAHTFPSLRVARTGRAARTTRSCGASSHADGAAARRRNPPPRGKTTPLRQRESDKNATGNKTKAKRAPVPPGRTAASAPVCCPALGSAVRGARGPRGRRQPQGRGRRRALPGPRPPRLALLHVGAPPWPWRGWETSFFVSLIGSFLPARDRYRFQKSHRSKTNPHTSGEGTERPEETS